MRDRLVIRYKLDRYVCYVSPYYIFADTLIDCYNGVVEYLRERGE